VPHLARRYRVLRPDLRGFGRSSVPDNAAEYPWSTEGFAADLARFLDALGVERAHIVGAKLGGSVAVQFAASYPARTLSLSVASGPVRAIGDRGEVERIRREGAHGLREWAAETQLSRLGSAASPEQLAWWTEMMASADPDVCMGVMGLALRFDLTDLLPAITAPALILTTQGSALQSVEAVRNWQGRIPDSRLVVLDGDTYHPSATMPDEVAAQILDLLQRDQKAVARP
jgi:pimeloyl-ACP methyl ester carboxylesterase